MTAWQAHGLRRADEPAPELAVLSAMAPSSRSAASAASALIRRERIQGDHRREVGMHDDGRRRKQQVTRRRERAQIGRRIERSRGVPQLAAPGDRANMQLHRRGQPRDPCPARRHRPAARRGQAVSSRVPTSYGTWFVSVVGRRARVDAARRPDARGVRAGPGRSCDDVAISGDRDHVRAWQRAPPCVEHQVFKC